MDSASQELAPSVKTLSSEEIEAEAKKILQLHGLFAVPVDPVALANRLGIRVMNAHFGQPEVSGAVAKRGGSTSILVNQTDAPFRKRFTIAHELGHQTLHLAGDGDFVDADIDFFRDVSNPNESARQRAEVQANQFAAALLMPSELVRQEFALDRSLKAMARKFNVSEEAMGYRLSRLSLG